MAGIASADQYLFQSKNFEENFSCMYIYWWCLKRETGMIRVYFRWILKSSRGSDTKMDATRHNNIEFRRVSLDKGMESTIFRPLCIITLISQPPTFGPSSSSFIKTCQSCGCLPLFMAYFDVGISRTALLTALEDNNGSIVLNLKHRERDVST